MVLASQSANAFKPIEAYERMASKWSLVDDLLGGTQAMRDAGKRWLPPERAETAEAYADRLSRSYLYGALADTIEKFVGLPFSRAISVKGQLPALIEPIQRDADLCGSSLSEFARCVFRDGLQHGLSYIMPSYPDVGEKDKLGVITTPNLYEEVQGEIRPYLQHIPAANVIGWRWTPAANGAKTLTQLRVREFRMEHDGDYGEVKAEYVRVYTPEFVEHWKRGKEGKPEMIGLVSHNLGRIPLVPYYVRPTGFMEADPPFMDLAWLNLEHWQNQSDQSNILHFTRMPILYWAGVTTEEKDQPVEIGPNRVLRSTNDKSTLSYVEHTGAAIGAGQKHLQAIEARMEVLGLSPAMERLQSQTATSRGIDDSNAKTAMQGWIRTLESSLETALRTCAELVKEEMDSDFQIDIKQDFMIGARAQTDIQALLQMRARGEITHERLLVEMKARGVLDESLDVAQEIEKAKAEGPPLGSITFDSFDRQPQAA